MYDLTAKKLIDSESNVEDLKNRLKENLIQKNRLVEQKNSELIKLKNDFEQSTKDNLALKQRLDLTNQVIKWFFLFIIFLLAKQTTCEALR